MSEYFIPFVSYFTQNPLLNPYDYAIQQNEKNAFPYPALMLYLIALPSWILGWVPILGNSYLIYRIPLLLADFTIFFIINYWINHGKKLNIRLIYLYSFSPILIYISYIYGQLDAIPIALLFLSMYFLFNQKPLICAQFLGCAIATKTHLIILIPFFILYLCSKRFSLRLVFLFPLIVISIFVLLNAPYLFSPSFLQMVFTNEAQIKVFALYVPFFSLSFYILPAMIILIFIRSALIRTFNREIFIILIGLTLSIFLIFIEPSPGWYFWTIPMFSYFYTKEKGRSFYIFIALQLAYLFYFIFSLHPYIDQPITRNLSFTFLQTMLGVNCLWLYHRGIKHKEQSCFIKSPFLLGIGGNSGTGKTLISQCLASIFGNNHTTILCGDDRHKWQRGDQMWDEFSHLNPKANNLHSEISDLKVLMRWKTIYRKHYDHDTGKFTDPYPIVAKNLIIFEGLHPFYLTQQRVLYNLKIFIKPDATLAEFWKISRDVGARGYTLTKVLNTIEKRKSDVQEYIHGQAEHADILLEPKPEVNVDLNNLEEEIPIYFKITLANSIYIDPLVEQIESIQSLRVKHSYNSQDAQIVEIHGDCDKEALDLLINGLVPNFEEIGIHSTRENWPDGLFGIILVIIIYCMFEEGGS
ncbi:MAG: hypothetical protein ACRCVN_02995 [Spirochaetia bacterium]